MKVKVQGIHDNNYILMVSKYAQWLDCNDLTIHEDGTISMYDIEGNCICEHEDIPNESLLKAN